MASKVSVRTAAFGASYVFVVATILPLIRREAWWIRLFDFPPPQITLGLLIAGAALLASRKRGTVAEKSTLALVAASTA